jgi:hypothetical protein
LEDLETTPFFGLNKNLSVSSKINSSNNLDHSNMLIMTDESENSSNFSLNKSSHSYNSSFDESTSPSRQTYNNKATDNDESSLNADKAESDCSNRISSISLPTWRQRHRNTFKSTMRRFHSAFIAKSALTSSIDKNSKNSCKSENDCDDKDVINKSYKQVRQTIYFFYK